ncbi:S9 family peptidase [Streptacidiphilus sp. P02-A3a]|uniref:alpha/beta hydrolase family protein n=1 Tax=Streptacidiphilus sp. P02-A3a TaxID=2704468 RepID=UPI0015FD0BE0|nr:alpha/beta hydrolase [Streptacidiphilus sp. P02-A3a]QMU67454.1 alpha/beta hydrolase [Streptacidiphilus sp. P02-A3a]
MSREVLSRPAPPPDRTAAYGPHPDQVVDLRLPPGPAGTLVVLVHGGFWRHEYDRGHTGPLADALARAGYAVAVPEYRRVGGPGGGWPGTFDDVSTCLEALGTICAARGVRPRRTVLLGHSAGGHLALWAAARHRMPPESPWRSRWSPDRVVSLAGCSVLDLADAWELDDNATADLLGGSAREVPERYALADPAALLPLAVPVTLLHGTADQQVPVAMSREYAARAERAGDSVELVELSGLDHFALIDPLSTAWPDLLAAIDS